MTTTIPTIALNTGVRMSQLKPGIFRVSDREVRDTASGGDFGRRDPRMLDLLRTLD